MRIWPVILLIVCVFTTSCGPKAAYQTREGRQKTKYYNKVQYGIEKNPTPPKSMTKNKKVKKGKKKN